MFQFKQLQTKLIFWFLALSLLPLGVFSFLGLSQSKVFIESSAMDKLSAVADLKHSQISDYFKASEENLRVVAGESGIQTALIAFSQAFEGAGFTTDSDEWKQLDKKYIDRATSLVEGYGWYDVFLISPNGDIVFTQAKESDLGQNILKSSIRSSGLGKLLSTFIEHSSADVLTSDFSPYAPSNGDPAAFQMIEVRSDSQLLGYLALQLPLNELNEIMQSREGMGETAETYLVGQDKRMRTDSYLSPEDHSVAQSFSGSVEKNGADTESVRQALAGNSGRGLILDYNGNSVLSVYKPFLVGENKWALIAEIDEAEAFEMAHRLRTFAFIILAISFVVVLAGAVFLARQISKPIVRLASSVEQMSTGDLTVSIEKDCVDEIGQLQTAFQTMVATLNSIINHIHDSSHQQASAATELSAITVQTKEIVSSQHSATDQVAAAINEMSATIDEVARNTTEAAGAAREADREVSNSKVIVQNTVSGIFELTQQLKETMGTINHLAQGVTGINGILSVIKGIADQTNL
ncbi:methyl-accepting chemotaxis protein [Pseudomaricurvus sp.]|uniref:methyl-accepting chemotaxis protein n=1 Tax=Pseudomaricurvus sp. TaxID=2004510 RepID=UPI003F6CFE96